MCIRDRDNLASLKLLEKTHKGKVDLIYIDPPSVSYTHLDVYKRQKQNRAQPQKIK